MSQHTMNKLNAAITTVAHKPSFNFRNWKQGQEGFTRLNALLESGKLTTDQITVTADKEGKAENDLYQRNPVTLEIEVPLVSSFIKDDFLTMAQIDHIQALINQTIEKAQQPAVDAGNTEDENLIPWYVVLEQPFKQRVAAVKITDDMLKAAVALYAVYLEDVGSSAKGIELQSTLGLKKFALTACIKVPHKVLERIQERIAGWVEDMEDTDKHTHSAVINLWAGNLEKVLNPEPEEELDADMI